jgi:hypothetical protein
MIGIIAWLNQNGKTPRLIYSSNDYCDIITKETEAITVNQRIFFFKAASAIYELSFNAGDSTSFLTKCYVLFIDHPTLTSIYSSIYCAGAQALVRYDISQKRANTFHSELDAISPALFTRSARYIYAVMGYADTFYKKVKKQFAIFDTKGEKKWKRYLFDCSYMIGRCKCIYSNNDIIIIGGCSKETYKIEFIENALKISKHSDLPFSDDLGNTMSAVYWKKSYYLISNAGILYVYNCRKKTIRWMKHWLEKATNIEPICYGG